MNKLKRGKQSQIRKKTWCKKEVKKTERRTQLRIKELKLSDSVFLF